MQKLLQREELLTLTDLKKAVDAQAARYLPDFVPRNPDDIRFKVINLHELTGDTTEPGTVGLQILDDTECSYLTTDWSRHQLLQAMGTKEKWFESVPLQVQADELNRRRDVIDHMMFRTMKGGDEEQFPCRPIRGIVSNVYSDIPNTEIMETLTGMMPEETCVFKKFSGQTDRAFYAYTVIDQPIGFPGHRKCYPGLIFKNSEVGYTSLWVIPFILLPENGGRVAVMEQRYLLRRIHRGKVDLKEKLGEAMELAAPLWQELNEKISRLGLRLFTDEDEALEAMSKLISQVKGSRAFAYTCGNRYKAVGYTSHSAGTIFETIVATAGDDFDQDSAFTHNAIAGAILLKLIL